MGCAIEVYGSRRRLERSNCRYAHAPFNADGNGRRLTADKDPLFTLAPNGVAIGKASGVRLLEGLLGYLRLVYPPLENMLSVESRKKLLFPQEKFLCQTNNSSTQKGAV